MSGAEDDPRALEELRAELCALHAARVGRKDAWMARTEVGRGQLQERLGHEFRGRLESALAAASVEARANPHIEQVFSGLGRYARRSEWNFIDPVLLMAATATGDPAVLREVATGSVVFHALRMVDDVIDGHRTYKGAYPTHYGELLETEGLREHAGSISLLGALLLLAEGGRGLSSQGLDLLSRTIHGALHELVCCDPRREYAAVVQGKMVSYGMLVYGPILAALEEPDRPCMHAFLERSFRVSQMVNDIADFDEDRSRGQPNCWVAAGVAVTVRTMLEELHALAAGAEEMSPECGDYANARLVDLCAYARSNLESLDSSAERRPPAS